MSQETASAISLLQLSLLPPFQTPQRAKGKAEQPSQGDSPCGDKKVNTEQDMENPSVPTETATRTEEAEPQDSETEIVDDATSETSEFTTTCPCECAICDSKWDEEDEEDEPDGEEEGKEEGEEAEAEDEEDITLSKKRRGELSDHEESKRTKLFSNEPPVKGQGVDAMEDVIGATGQKVNGYEVSENTAQQHMQPSDKGTIQQELEHDQNMTDGGRGQRQPVKEAPNSAYFNFYRGTRRTPLTANVITRTVELQLALDLRNTNTRDTIDSLFKRHKGKRIYPPPVEAAPHYDRPPGNHYTRHPGMGEQISADSKTYRLPNITVTDMEPNEPRNILDPDSLATKAPVERSVRHDLFGPNSDGFGRLSNPQGLLLENIRGPPPDPPEPPLLVEEEL